MKKNYTLLTLLFTIISIAQIPANYYDSATGTGYTLKNQLHNIINNNTNSSSSSSNYGGLWDLYINETAFQDVYDDNDNSIYDVYSEIIGSQETYGNYPFTPGADQCGGTTPSNEGGCYNREHTLPQAVWGSGNYPMYSDAHFVIPTDNRVNGWRDNYPFGVVTTTITPVTASNATANNAGSTPCITTNGSKLGQNSNSGYAAGYTGVVFEPIDEFKGDIARALLYFGTRYQDQIPSWSYEMFNGTGDQVFTNTFLNILISWHNLDPVSSYEIAKNEAVYNFQGNANPFISHPEYVCEIWPTQCAALSTNSFALQNITVYPNPSTNGVFNIASNVDLTKISVYNINGQLIQQIENPSKVNNNYMVSNLPTGFYLLQLEANSAKETRKVIVN